MASMCAISMHSISAVRPPKYPSDGLHHHLRSLYTLIPQVITTVQQFSVVLSGQIKGKLKEMTTSSSFYFLLESPTEPLEHAGKTFLWPRESQSSCWLRRFTVVLHATISAHAFLLHIPEIFILSSV